MTWSCVYQVGVSISSGNLNLSTVIANVAIAAGDLIVCEVGYSGTANFTPPTGWASANAYNGGDLVAGGIRSAEQFWIVRGASAPDGIFTRTGGDRGRCTVTAYRWGGAAGTITLGPVSQNTLGSASTVATTGALTIATAESLISLFLTSASGNVTAAGASATSPSTYANVNNTTTLNTDVWSGRRLSDDNDTAPGTRVRKFDARKTATGSTGTIQVTSTVSLRHTLLASSFYVATSGGGTAYNMPAATGVYSLTGQAANLSSARSMAADAGSYVLTGQAANFPYGRRIAADPGSYALTGQTANFSVGRRMVADTGSYSLTGQAANFSIARRLVADAGSYAFTGNAATLVFVAAGINYSITAEAGTYTLSGQAANFSAARRIIAEAGSYTLSGQPSGLSFGRRLTAEAGSYALTGQAATFRAGYTMTAESGEYSLYGHDADFVYAPYAAARPLFFIIG